MARTQIWSSGGGVQSAAIAALIRTGQLPKPDLAVIVDTGREVSQTWAYMKNVIVPALREVGVDLVRIAKEDYATVDLYRGEEILIPAFTTQGVGVGKLPTYCSNEWKRRPMQRWAAEQGVESADIWIGISTDELRRCRQTIGKWVDVYPLINLRKNRGDCMALVERMGWPKPPKSRCWMCPNQNSNEWQEMRLYHQEDFVKAIEFQNEMREIDEDLWLTQTAIPLEQDDFSSLPDLFTGRCDSGMCFV
jgi:hypothetical protein